MRSVAWKYLLWYNYLSCYYYCLLFISFNRFVVLFYASQSAVEVNYTAGLSGCQSRDCTYFFFLSYMRIFISLLCFISYIHIYSIVVLIYFLRGDRICSAYITLCLHMNSLAFYYCTLPLIKTCGTYEYCALYYAGDLKNVGRLFRHGDEGSACSFLSLFLSNCYILSLSDILYINYDNNIAVLVSRCAETVLPQ